MSEKVKIYVTILLRKLIYSLKSKLFLCVIWLFYCQKIHIYPPFYRNVTIKKKDFHVFLSNIHNVKTL